MNEKPDVISIRGARQHNLKNVSLDIPKNQLVVLTGMSGSGKSSLAFDTIYAEGQRRYVESLSSYARQFLGVMGKPDVDFIGGLSPAISIDQKTTSHNPRSTVGTITEIYDYLRLLFARVGRPHCPNCGDENALKNVQAAEKAGKPIQEFIDENAESFRVLAENLDVQFDVFQKGSDTKTHYPSSQELWKRCDANGDIYKKTYTGLYCVGCETFYDRDELNENGECFEHPGKPLEEVSEENYFFRLSKYQSELTKLIESDTLSITPISKKNEVLSFLKTQTLQDISISRTNARAKNWGVPVPGDDTQRMYVWFDALNIYQSGVGFGWDQERYEKWWPADVHVIGKGIIRFHAVYWPAFLLSAKLPLPKSLFVHGYFTVNGQKMSKSIGNVVDPNEVIAKYGVDFARFYFLYEIPTFDDGDFSFDRANQLYLAEFSNGLGNLVSRVAALCAKSNAIYRQQATGHSLSAELIQSFEQLDLRESLRLVWKKVWDLNKKLSDDEPWKKDADELGEYLQPIVYSIQQLAIDLKPFLPSLSAKLQNHFAEEHIGKLPPLFPKLIE